MSTGGLSDVYRYGVRFVGYLLVVTLVGGLFVAAGAALGGNLVAAALGSSTAGAASATTVLAIALAAIGVLLLLSGLFGLAHKLVADATLAGAQLALDGSDATGVPTPADGAGVADGTGPVEADAGVPSTDPVDDSPTGTDGSTAQEPSDDGAAESVDDGPTGAEVEPPISRDDEPSVDGAAESVDDGPTGAEVEPTLSRDDESSGDGAAATARDGASESVDDGDPAAGHDTQPEEWSPPDPSEFEPARAAGETDDDAAADSGWDMSESESTEPRTADDLFGESDGEGEESPELFDDEPTDDGGATGFETDADDDPLSDTTEESS